MKRSIVHFVLGLCVAGLVHADQTTQSVQQALKDQGFYYGNVTGDKSAETTAAIRRYQIRNGLQVSGDINPEILRSLNLNANSASLPQPASKPAGTQSNSVSLDDGSRVGQNSPQSPSSQPDGRAETKSNFSGALYPTAPPRMKRRMIVAEVQRQLLSRGYYGGRIDGSYRRRTAFALREFQLQSGLPPTGRLDTSTLQALGLSDASLAYLQPTSRLHETRVPVWKFKHGKWKLKWKKHHGDNREEYEAEDRWENGAAWWRGGEDHDE